MHPLAAPGTLWVLSSDGKYLVRPQADETSHKKQISDGRQGKSLPCFHRITEDFASAEATKGLSGRPLETFGPLLRMGDSTRNRFLVAGRKRAFLAFHASQRVSPQRRRPKGFPVALWKPSALCCAWGIPQETDSLWQAGKRPAFPPAPLGAPSPKPNTGGGTAPLGAFHRLSSFILLWSVPIPPLPRDAS